GGDFGEERHHGNFCINGIVASDGRPKAALYECKWVYQPAVATWEDVSRRLVRIENRHATQSLEDYGLVLQLLEDGLVMSEKELPPLALPAGEARVLSLEDHLPRLKTDREYLVNLSSRLKEQRPWADKGHVVAS